MLLPDADSRQFSRKQAHVPGHQKPLLSGHVPQDLFLKGPGF
jgi:hypothetical protein